MQKRWILVNILLFVTVILIVNTFFIVDQRQSAIVLQFGKPIRTVKNPGLHIKVPFTQNVEWFDNRIQNWSSSTYTVYTTDKKKMEVDAYFKYRIVDPLQFYKTVVNESNFKARLSTLADANLRRALGAAPFRILLSQERDELVATVRENLTIETESAFGVEVLDVRVIKTDLPERSRNAVYGRMKSEMEKQAKKIRAEGEEEAKKVRAVANKERIGLIALANKKSQTIKGEGEATATKIFADAFTKDPEFFYFYRAMQAYDKAFEVDTDFVINSDSEFMKYFGAK